MSIPVIVRTIGPDELLSPVPPWELLAPSNPESVLVLHVNGHADEWARVDSSKDARRIRTDIRWAPVITMAQVRGDLPDCLLTINAHDLAFLEAPDGATVLIPDFQPASSIGQIIDDVKSAPLAALAAAQLLRFPEGGLLAESATYSMLQAGPEFRRWLSKRRPGAQNSAAGSSGFCAQGTVPQGGRLSVTNHETVAEVVLQRPEKANAIDISMREELCDVLDALSLNESVAIALRGAGRSFSSGGDLDEFGTLTDPAMGHLIRTTRSIARRLARTTSRLVAGVHGACVGAGIELPAFARSVVASPDTIIKLPELRMGLLPGAGGTVSIPRRIGRQRTLELLLTGRTITANEALRLGLVDELVVPDQLRERTLEIARSMMTPAADEQRETR